MRRLGWVALVAAGLCSLSWGCGASGAGPEAAPPEAVPDPVRDEPPAPPAEPPPPPPPPVKEEEPPPDNPGEQPSDARPPGVPTRFTVRPVVGALEVSWAPPEDDGGTPVTEYTLRWFNMTPWGEFFQGGETQTFSSAARRTKVRVQVPASVRVELTARNAVGSSEPLLSEVLSAIEPIRIGVHVRPLPGEGFAAVEVYFHRWSSTPAKLVLEYQDPSTGRFLPASLVDADSWMRDVFAAPHPRPARMVWAHNRDLPGAHQPYALPAVLRARALAGELELGSSVININLRSQWTLLEAPLEQRTGEGPLAVSVGDFNGDGRADLAVANQASANIAVYFQTGDGLPEHSVRFTPMPVATELLVTGDFNSDGKLDLATGGRSAWRAFTLLGRGDGHFAPGPDVPMGGPLDALALADVNGDGKGDLVSLSSDDSRYQVALGKGDGSFAAARRFEAPLGARWMDVGDFNGDGRVDLGFGSWGMKSGVTVAKGQGDGTFRFAGFYPCLYLDAVGVGDVDGDGVAELLATCRQDRDWSDFQAVHLLALSPDGSEELRSRLLGMTRDRVYHRIHVGDVTGDRRPDLLLAAGGAGPTSDGLLVVMPKRNDGSFHAGQEFPLHSPLSLALGDLNGDRLTDVAVAGARTYSTPGCVELLFGKEDGSLGPVSSRVVDRKLHDVLPVDLDVDGRMDLVVAQDVVSLRLGRGDGTFQPAREQALAVPPRALASADFNGDARPELLVADADGAVRVWAFKDGALTPGAELARVPSAMKLATTDFNGDALPDVLVSRSEGKGPVLLLSNPEGFEVVEPAVEGGLTVDSAFAADADRDGHVDVVIGGYRRSLVLLRGDGRGGFTPASLAPNSGSVAHVGDLTGDGWPDLLTHGCQLLMGQGDGTFAPVPGATFLGCNRAGVGDFDGDGRLEVLGSQQWETGTVHVMRLDASKELQTLGILGAFKNAREKQFWAADFNGDGIDDPVIYRYSQVENDVTNELSLSLSGPCTTACGQ
jgi:hypothetical protein